MDLFSPNTMDLIKAIGVSTIVCAIFNYFANKQFALRKELNDEIIAFTKFIRCVVTISSQYWCVDGRDLPKENDLIIKLRECKGDLVYILDKLKLEHRNFLLKYSDFWEEITSGNFQSKDRKADVNRIKSISDKAEAMVSDVRAKFSVKFCSSNRYIEIGLVFGTILIISWIILNSENPSHAFKTETEAVVTEIDKTPQPHGEIKQELIKAIQKTGALQR